MTDSTTQTTNGTLADGTSVGQLYVDTADNLFNKVVVVDPSLNRSSVAGGSTGLTTYGKQLVYYNGTSIQSEFWAQQIESTNGSKVWALHWNSNNEFRSGAIPVVLKTLAPAS